MRFFNFGKDLATPSEENHRSTNASVEANSVVRFSELPMLDEKTDMGYLRQKLADKKKKIIGAASLLAIAVVGVVVIASSTGGSQQSSQQSGMVGATF